MGLFFIQMGLSKNFVTLKLSKLNSTQLKSKLVAFCLIRPCACPLWTPTIEKLGPGTIPKHKSKGEV